MFLRTLKVALVSQVLLVAALPVVLGQPAHPPAPPPGAVATAATYAGSSYYIKARSSQLYLDVEGASSEIGAPVRLYAFNASKAQVFTFEDAGSGYYRIRTNTGGLYLTLTKQPVVDPGGSTSGTSRRGGSRTRPTRARRHGPSGIRRSAP